MGSRETPLDARPPLSSDGRMRLLSLLAVAALAVGCAYRPSVPPPTEIPLLRGPDGRLVVHADVDGQGPFPFILDTGASVTLLDLALANELALTGSGREVIVHGVAGIATATAHPGITIGLGQDAVTPRFVAVLDLPERDTARGVLGVDVVGERVLEIDPGAGVVRLGRAAYAAPPGAAVSRANLVVDSHGLPLVEAEINGEPGLALVDTGLAGMIIAPDFAARAGVSSRDGPVTLVDVMSQTVAVRRSGRARLSIGRARWSVERVALLRPPVFDLIDQPAEAILGANVFAASTLVIDFERRELYIVDRRRGAFSRRIP